MRVCQNYRHALFVIIVIAFLLGRQPKGLYSFKMPKVLEKHLYYYYIKKGDANSLASPSLTLIKNLFEVVLPGFEPRQTEPKPVVLPLHHRTILCASFRKSGAKLGVFIYPCKLLAVFYSAISKK